MATGCDLKVLRRKRGSIKQKLTWFSTFVDKIYDSFCSNDNIEEQTVLDLQSRSERLVTVLDEYEGIQLEIEQICDENDLESEYKNRFEFLDLHAKYVTKSKYLLKKLLPDDTSSNNSSSNRSVSVVQQNQFRSSHENFHLPTISLPTFNGEFQKWLEFKETFECMINKNESLNNIQRFHYLRSSLEPKIINIIENLDFSAENYAIAWKTLCQRFDNKHLLVNSHIKPLFELKNIQSESIKTLRLTIDIVRKHIHALNNLSLKNDNDLSHALLVYMISEKLDKITLTEWEKSSVNKDLPKLEELLIFLEKKADFLETMEVKGRGNFAFPSSDNKLRQKRQNVSFYSGNTRHHNTNKTCHLCKQTHLIYSCGDFLKLNIADRWTKVKELKLCSNCLCKGHFSKTCSYGSCKYCHGKHNSLLHHAKPDFGCLRNENTIQPESNETNDQSIVNFSKLNSKNYILLSTALVHIADRQGKFHKARALLDSGSQSSFISADLCERLDLKQSHANLSIVGINNVKSNISNKCVVSLGSLYNSSHYNITCFVLPQISENLPLVNINRNVLNIPNDIELADPNFHVSSQIDILIGANLFWMLLCDGKIILGKNLPILQNTTLGFIVAGNYPLNISTTRCFFSKTDSLHDDLQKFWAIEEVSSSEQVLSDNQICEEHFLSTVSKDETGKFIVRIPFKAPPNILGDSKSLATKRLLNLEARFKKDKSLKENYISFMKEYADLGHMSVAEDTDCSKPSYFLPHHGVLKEDSKTTKLRVVFDGSAITASGHSLNSIQHTGPKIQNDIFHILLRFRFHPYVVVSDIEKMYRCILVHPKDRDFQKILWRSDSNDSISVMKLNTVTYGTASAPFLAIRCLKQIANEFHDTFPEASQIILDDFYVDDLITTFDDIHIAKKRCQEISQILHSAGFNLRKWASNNEEILTSVHDITDSLSVLILGKNDKVKTLGIQWYPQLDSLGYNISISTNEVISKRSILSEIAKIYDPLGLLSPCTILAKIMIQKLWQLNLDWDVTPPDNISNEWCLFRSQLSQINELKINRFVSNTNETKIQLHGFSDASLKAYSAVIYCRSFDESNNVTVRLVCAKTKIAPLKRLTVPRLELCGALLLSRLTHVLQNSLKQPVDSFYWCGPEFLYNKSFTPVEFKLVSSLVIPEKKEPINISFLGLPVIKFDTFSKFSTFNRLVRVHAYCLRFIYNLRCSVSERQYGVLTLKELENSKLSLVKVAQCESFHDEIAIIQLGHTLKAKHRLQALAPFVDDEGLLRVGGRLKHSSHHFNRKHPLLLDGKHVLSRLIVEHEHVKLLHAAPQLLLSSVRQKYWPTSGINLAKSVVRKCMRCFKYNPKGYATLMADLPEARVSVSLPFTHTGIDYAGPFILKDRKGRGCKTFKAYICLFICFSVKAVHLELVTDLTTESFLATLRRFVSRRGKPSHIYSDNGSNFIGAHNELKLLYAFLQNSHSDITNSLANEGIEWHFIPPNSPSFGGLWESNIKGVKRHLSRVIGATLLTYEEFSTILVQVEAILNSRPLYPISSDPNDFESLTPSHFLIGRTHIAVADPELKEGTKMNRLSRYQLLQQFSRSFWQQWSRSYLSELQSRTKWKTKSNNLEIGRLVLIRHDNLPSYQWLLGRITKVHPGEDGIVRVVTLKTQRGEVKRSVTKLCPLPDQEDPTN